MKRIKRKLVYQYNRIVKLLIPLFDSNEFSRSIALKLFRTNLYSTISEEKYYSNLESCKIEFKDYDFSKKNLNYFLYMYKFHGFMPDEMFFLNLIDKPVKEIVKDYLSEGELENFCASIGNFGKNGKFFFDKYATYLRFKDYFYREVLAIDCEDDFLDFIKDKSAFLLKDSSSSRGRGVTYFKVKEIDDLNAFYKENIEGGNFVVEEVIDNPQEIKEFNPDSVNTIRVPAFNTKNGVKLFPYASFRVGRSGSFVDSCGRGGLSCNIDTKTGIVITDWFDEHGNVFEKHPDTNISVKGFKLPEWEKVYKTLCELYRIAPEVKYTGWDFVYIEKNGEKHWAIIEGNAGGQLAYFQVRAKRGLKKEFKDIIKQI